MKLIPLTRGMFTQVDDEDYEYLIQWSWKAHKGSSRSKTYYAGRIDSGIWIFIHSSILRNAKKGLVVDHKDRNGLNNQRLNLRLATFSQNGANRTPSGKSKYLGVSWCKCSWRASITINKKCYKLGRYKTEEGAAVAYDKKAKEVWGEFANLNFKEL